MLTTFSFYKKMWALQFIIWIICLHRFHFFPFAPQIPTDSQCVNQKKIINQKDPFVLQRRALVGF